MVPVCDKPILVHQVEWLQQVGVTDVVFLVGYRWQTIQDYFADGSHFGVRAHYSVEDSPLGRGGAIKQGFSQVPEEEESVLVLNGDVVTAQSPTSVLNTYRQSKSANPSHEATIMVVPMVSPYGLVDTDDQDTVVGFREKVELPYWINAGIYVFSRSIAPQLPDLGDHETDTDGLPAGLEAAALPPGTAQGINNWNKAGYGGPCPPVRRHRYFHMLYALDTRLTGLTEPTKDEVENAMAGHILDRTELVGTYEKSK
jgi:NDP-sugar pyrophosphorylase family protein